MESRNGIIVLNRFQSELHIRTAYKYPVRGVPNSSGLSSKQVKHQAVLEQSSIRTMASLKAVKPAGQAGQAKEPAPKLSETVTKPSAAKGGVKKAEQKPREPKKKA
ncbi:hypothetical protein EJB05_53404, partial [Eragrostis curvula]